MNLREAWAKRRYQAHFIGKLTDCYGEHAETGTNGADLAVISEVGQLRTDLECAALLRFGSGALDCVRAIRAFGVIPARDPKRCRAPHSLPIPSIGAIWAIGAREVA